MMLTSTGRTAGAGLGHMHLLDLIEEPGAVGGEHAGHARGETGADDHVRPGLPAARRSRASSPRTSVRSSETDTIGIPNPKIAWPGRHACGSDPANTMTSTSSGQHG